MRALQSTAERGSRPAAQEDGGGLERSPKPAPAEDPRRLDSTLDEALEETFPASDPVAIGRTD